LEYTSLATWVNGNPSVISIRSGVHRIFDNTVTVTGVEPPTRVFDMATLRRDDGNGRWRTMRTWGRCGAKAVTLTRSGTTATGTTGDGANSHGVCNAGTRVRITGAGAPFDGDFTATSTNGCSGGISNLSFTYTVANSGSASSSGTLTSPFDGNSDETGHLCMDQAGAGQTVLFTELIPTNSSPRTTSDPIYIWNNLRDSDSGSGATYGLSSGAYNSSGQISATVVENRDFYNQTDNFTGVSGIGRGPRSARPATCTAGVAYWSTDQGSWNTESSADHNAHDPSNLTHTLGEDGVLDKCTSTNTWTNAWYTPLAYPHPLLGGGRGVPENQTPQVTITAPTANFSTSASTQVFSVTCVNDVACTAVTMSVYPRVALGRQQARTRRH
jgi:hypothetical protein